MSIKPITPKGTRDFSPAEVARRTYLKETLQEAFETFGFEPIETPSFERLETLTGVYGEEGDRLVFKIINSGEKVKKADVEALAQGSIQKFVHSLSEKALRYDLTVPFARYVAQHQNELSFPFRRYQIQPVWRADRPQHGRFQEFYQCDADIVGNRSLWQEIEMLSLYDNAFSKLKIEGVSLKINHRKILAGIAALLGAESKLTSFTVALDKLDKIGKEGVIKELKTHDFSENALHTLEQLLELKGSAYEQLETLEKLFDDHNEGLEGIHELKFILTQLEVSPLEKVSLNFDLTLARGLHYYTGMIVEVSAPDTVKMGSIGGGGRYDDLTGTFGLKNMSGIGVSFGFERIFLVMDALGLFPETLQASAEVLFANFGDAAAAVAYHYVNELRTHGIACELYPTEAKLKKQLAYANDKKIAKVILIGSEELEQKQFVLKDMDTGNQTTYSLKKLLSLLS
ncbi:histidine--tRNA ligase [Flavobacteriaceae bacterium]|nr:histidine--tRNA ligase [Flavobacteriaceae bacterium]MDA9572110.1 histidine--tRNA ligase [Flavobacteriaceae bacterium]MDB3862633.1 histidine--tRNA ligase [Flavobacteriaceae bacterium]